MKSKDYNISRDYLIVFKLILILIAEGLSSYFSVLSIYLEIKEARVQEFLTNLSL